MDETMQRDLPFGSENSVQSVPAAGPGDYYDRPSLCHVSNCYTSAAPLSVTVVFEVRQHVLAVPGARRRHESILCESQDDAVVKHHSILAQTDHVLAASDPDCGSLRKVHPIEESTGLGTRDLDLAER